MSDDLQFDRLADIPDPLAETALPALRRPDLARLGPSPTRARSRAIRVLALAAALLYDAAWPLFVERRPQLEAVPLAQLGLGLAIPLVAAGLAVAAAGPRWGGAKARVVALVLASPAVFATATLATAPILPDPSFWRHAAGCLGVTSVLAVGPLFFAAFAFRRAFATLAAWRMAALGSASGALAAAAMNFVCPIGSAAHIVLAHGAMILFAATVGGALGPRVARA